MAKVYSWEVSKTPSKYAYIVSPKNLTDVYIGNELKGSNLEKVKEWAMNCTETEYEAQFNKMVAACASRGYNVEFESVAAYMKVDALCSDLRGPAGRGIDRIALHSKDEVRNVNIYNIYYNDGTYDTFEVQNGQNGRDGIDGTPGTKGDSGVSSKFIMVYTSGIDEDGNRYTPLRPEGGSYDFVNNTTTYPQGWGPHDSELTPPIWTSTRTFSTSEASTDKQWSLPTQITGENGLPGVDGITTEFIYYLGEKEPNVTGLPSPNESGYVPPIETGWTPSPTGVDEDNTTEWCSLRKIDRETKKWGPWEKAFIWSKYGINGQDGDGVQYIYLKNTGTQPKNPTPLHYNDPSYDVYKSYQNKDTEWVPPADSSYINIDGETVQYKSGDDKSGIWLDNPSDVTAEFQSQWVCSRKYRKIGEDNNGKTIMAWEAFSAPALWGRFGQDGKSATSVRKLYALSTSTSNPPDLPGSSTVTGDWGTGFPVDYENGVNVVWGTEAEIWGHNFEFVMSYKVVSTKDANGNIVPPHDYNGNFIVLPEVPTEEVTDYKYIRVNDEYYKWTGGWCQPYIVTGLKGDRGPRGERGPQGIQGPVGPQGVTGLPGTHLITMYCLGTATEYFGGKEHANQVLPDYMTDWYNGTELPYSDCLEARNQNDINEFLQVDANRGRVIKLINNQEIQAGDSKILYTTHTYYLITSDKQAEQLTDALSIEESEEYNIYIWCIQGNEKWEIKDNQHTRVGVEWGKPFKLQGTNGLRGLTGRRGQVVYPMGVYNNEEVYITTEDKAPYVYDSNDGLYYVYNSVGTPWVGKLPENYKEIKKEDGTYKYSIDGTGMEGTWMEDHNGDTPANNYANLTNDNRKPAWVRFESFQALYASIGIIENGMVGSAVYNNEFMFSQQGIDAEGNPINYATSSGEDATYGFLSGYQYDNKGDSNGRHWKYKGSNTNTYIENIEVNPYELRNDENGSYFPDIENGKPIHTFRPNICINFATGQMWLSGGEIQFGKTRNVLTSTEVDTKFTQSGFVTGDGFAEMFSTKVLGESVEGNTAKDKLSSFIKTEAGDVTISGDNIFIDGATYIDGQLQVTNGQLKVSEALIDKCTVTNVTVQGSMRSPFVLDDNVEKISLDKFDYSDNIAFLTSLENDNDAVVYSENIKWGPDQSGRKITLVNAKWKDKNNIDTLATGFVQLDAPSIDVSNLEENFQSMASANENIFSYSQTTKGYPNMYVGGHSGTIKITGYQGFKSFNCRVQCKFCTLSIYLCRTWNDRAEVFSITHKDPNDIDDRWHEVSIPQDVLVANLKGSSNPEIQIVMRFLDDFYDKNYTCSSSIALPIYYSNMGFFENGRLYKSISFSREALELIGYGTPDTFYGWIVTNRNDVLTNSYYGKEVKALAWGEIHLKDGALDNEKTRATTYDNTPVILEYEPEGKFKIMFQEQWGSRLDKCFMMVSPLESTSHPIAKYDKDTSTFTVELRIATHVALFDQDHYISYERARGSFAFMLVNIYALISNSGIIPSIEA